MRRVVLLLVLTLLAGCLGGVGPGGSSGSAGPDDAAWTDGESINTTTLSEQHFETLRDEGSFTVNHSETVRVDGEARPAKARRPDGYTPPSYLRQQVDLEDGRYLGESVTVGHRRSAQFVSPEETAARQTTASTDGYEYRYQQRAEDTRSERLDRFRTEAVVEGLNRSLRGVTVGFDYTHAGTVERDGETLHRYEAEQDLETAPPPFAEPPHGTATVLVTEAGVVRRFELEYAGEATVTVDGEEQTVEVAQTFVRTYTAVGDTTVERPDWVDHAAEEDPPRETETGDT
ncbi:MAG: hypothetical protein ACI8U4_001733 [Natronomonas sp.]|jgi:hypothetical protein